MQQTTNNTRVYGELTSDILQIVVFVNRFTLRELWNLSLCNQTFYNTIFGNQNLLVGLIKRGLHTKHGWISFDFTKKKKNCEELMLQFSERVFTQAKKKIKWYIEKNRWYAKDKVHYPEGIITGLKSKWSTYSTAKRKVDSMKKTIDLKNDVIDSNLKQLNELIVNNTNESGKFTVDLLLVKSKGKNDYYTTSVSEKIRNCCYKISSSVSGKKRLFDELNEEQYKLDKATAYIEKIKEHKSIDVLKWRGVFKKALNRFIIIASSKSSISKQLKTKIKKYNRLLNEIDSIQERLNMQHSSNNTNQNATTTNNQNNSNTQIGINSVEHTFTGLPITLV